MRQRKFEVADMRLLAECVYAAKFIAEGQAKRLVDVICEFVSEDQASKIRHNAFLTDRVKTDNKGVMNNIAAINEAMSRELNGQRHKPEKIDFLYQKHSISDVRQTVNRRNGARYIVSPYKLIINDGNYYLLAFDDYSKEMRTYRVDRMKDIRFTGEPRDGDDEFKKIDLKTYTKRVFSMFGGKRERVTIRFIDQRLDTVVDQFGIAGVKYEKVDDTHFTAQAEVEISDMFYSWVCGFGRRAKIIDPPHVVEGMREFVKKVSDMYEPR